MPYFIVPAWWMEEGCPGSNACQFIIPLLTHATDVYMTRYHRVQSKEVYV